MKKDSKMRYCKTGIYGTYIIGYVLSFILADLSHHYLAGTVLMVLAVALYVQALIETRNLVDMRGLFSLSWIGGQGLACLQLSKLQNDWNPKTWLCFGLAYLCFCLGYEKSWNRKSEKVTNSVTSLEEESRTIIAKRLLVCIISLTVASIICFGIEVMIVGYVPILSQLPHAYSYFHVSGIHYFTISCILIPALSVLYIKEQALKAKGAWWMLGSCNAIAVAIPILCVSRFQLLFAVMFAVVVYIVAYKRIKFKTIVFLIISLVPLYILLTIARNHDVSYLNGVFEMKYARTPIFITQPYMYIANNYENFNCMVEQLTQHTFGLKMIFPVLALTGLKFIFPQWVVLPTYITKKELTTLTLFYDAYFDFGIIGIAVFAMILGIVAKRLVCAVKNNPVNPITFLFYGQIVIYLGLSFFTTWFSNPTTWFWLVLTTMMHIYIGYPKKEKEYLNERTNERTNDSRCNYPNL